MLIETLVIMKEAISPETIAFYIAAEIGCAVDIKPFDTEAFEITIFCDDVYQLQKAERILAEYV